MAAKICELRRLRQEDAEDFGSKAANLGELHSAGFKVPHGYALDKVPSKSEGDDIADILRYEQRYRKICYAVRSSAIGEDSEERSYAGQFESKLNIPADAVYKTLRHMADHIPDRVYAYDPKFKPKNLRFIIQEMVPAVRAGVVFTRDPMDHDSMVMEIVDGLGDKLVSGEVTPITTTILRPPTYLHRVPDVQRFSTEDGYHLYTQPDGTLADAAEPHIPVDMSWPSVPAFIADMQTEGIRYTTRPICQQFWNNVWLIEQHFGRPQDIEFAIDKGGTVWFLQARPITS